MINRFIIGLSLVVAAALVAGCAGPEQKLGRGITNATELTRMGEFQKSLEQESLFSDTQNTGFATGAIKGFDNTMKRTGMGLYEIVTFPFPPYHPVLTKYVSPKAGGPDAYIMGHFSSPTFDTDSYTGFSGGEVAPFIPGSRFTVFDN